MEFAEPQGYGTFSNSECVNCVKYEWGTERKVPIRDPNKGDRR
jgi:hypothetical protein